ncbi:hypothetical protein [Sediminivirga luteola]|uniref:Shikimate dehydrogenase n=1 Tax=Sediminivirga luteola TaxID=1774748 RepID=A0A8J2XKZ8_9MICO|nr:hypothetical protein [Sediminivirga luteola]GGA18559.1 hypothetical protein GCM10011333_22030 [Sediminivirga luteola]
MISTDNPLLTIDEVASWSGDPLYLFVGVSTAGSSIHRAFPVWAPVLAPGSTLRGIDVPESAPAETFRRLLTAMRGNPRVHGAVITSHKLRLYRAAAELFDHIDPLAQITHEVNCVDSRHGLRGFARDPQSLDLVLDEMFGSAVAEREFVCLGAGGSATALLLAMRVDLPASLQAGRAIPRAGRGPVLRIVGRRQSSLDEIDGVRERAGLPAGSVELVLAEDTPAVDRVVAGSAENAVVMNATGLGKTSPGSPLSDPSAFPAGALAWDFNYRGPLTFLEQARSAGTAVEDGWDYFLAGWSAALCTIRTAELTDETFGKVKRASRELRP